jgi:glycine hydroxymethyltransferase
MKEAHMATVVDMIDKAIVNADNEEALASLRKDVNAFMKQFPLYPELG